MELVFSDQYQFFGLNKFYGKWEEKKRKKKEKKKKINKFTGSLDATIVFT